jgi:hypothetical protein
MQITREYEMQQVDLAIRYYEKALQDSWSVNEHEKISNTLKSLASKLKELTHDRQE